MWYDLWLGIFSLQVIYLHYIIVLLLALIGVYVKLSIFQYLYSVLVHIQYAQLLFYLRVVNTWHRNTRKLIVQVLKFHIVWDYMQPSNSDPILHTEKSSCVPLILWYFCVVCIDVKLSVEYLILGHLYIHVLT
jgi:hypothetical protein